MHVVQLHLDFQRNVPSELHRRTLDHPQGGGDLTNGHNHRNFVPDPEDTLLRPYW